MSVGILKLGIIIVFFLITLQAGGKQDPVEVPLVGKTLSADKVEIVYMSQGSGETAVIFIHGGFADRSFWRNQVKPFAAKYRVIALDLAGHGESGKNRKKWDIFGFAQDVRAVMEKEKIRRAVLVGNSLGGPVALETARLVPDKVLAIVAVDTFQVFMNPPPGYFQQQARALRSDFTGTMRKMVRALFHKDVDPGLYAQVEKKMLKNSIHMAAGLMEFFATYDLVKTAKQVPHPIRCINGDLLLPTQVEKNREVHPDFNAVILPHTGHYPMLVKPELFNRHLEKILSEITTAKKEGGQKIRGNILDMTYPFGDSSVYWPTGKSFKAKPMSWGINDQGWWYASNDYSANEHGGTHVDAPIHFYQKGRTMDQIPLQEWIAPAVKIDVTKQCQENRDYLLKVKDITNFEKKHGKIPPKAWVIMYTGIGTRFYLDRKKVLGTDMKGEEAVKKLSFPGFSVESVKFLLKERDITGIAIDTPSIDYGKSTEFLVHRELFKENKLAIENIANLDKLPPTGAMLYPIPMLIEKGTGAPARIFAFLPD
jgi:kynurenine formamidase/pimeloyl-ACP methyl ester carboxylesterase